MAIDLDILIASRTLKTLEEITLKLSSNERANYIANITPNYDIRVYHLVRTYFGKLNEKAKKNFTAAVDKTLKQYFTGNYSSVTGPIDNLSKLYIPKNKSKLNQTQFDGLNQKTSELAKKMLVEACYNQLAEKISYKKLSYD